MILRLPRKIFILRCQTFSMVLKIQKLPLPLHSVSRREVEVLVCDLSYDAFINRQRSLIWLAMVPTPESCFRSNLVPRLYQFTIEINNPKGIIFLVVDLIPMVLVREWRYTFHQRQILTIYLSVLDSRKLINAPIKNHFFFETPSPRYF